MSFNGTINPFPQKMDLKVLIGILNKHQLIQHIALELNLLIYLGVKWHPAYFYCVISVKSGMQHFFYSEQRTKHLSGGVHRHYEELMNWSHYAICS